MAKIFRRYEPDQLLLMPPSLSEWVPEGHLARFVGDLVDELDLSAIEESYGEERGYPPYHPRMMVKVLLYAYCTGTFSSRRIAAKVIDSVAFRFLAAGNEPDFRTVSDFRKRHGQALSGLFEQVLRMCRKAGLVKLGRVAVDGTRIKANASKHKAMSYGRMKEKETALKEEIRDLLRRAEAIDKEEDRRYGVDKTGEELPEELTRRESRLKKIKEAKAALEEEARAQARAEAKTAKGPVQRKNPKGTLRTPSRRSRRLPTDSFRATTLRRLWMRSARSLSRNTSPRQPATRTSWSSPLNRSNAPSEESPGRSWRTPASGRRATSRLSRRRTSILSSPPGVSNTAK